MTEGKTVSAMTEGPKGRSMFLVLAGLAAVIVVFLAIYLGLQKSGLVQEQETLRGEINELNQEIASLEGQKVQAAQLAQQWIDRLEEEEIRWSTVLSQVQSLIPFDAAANSQKIQFLSYSGSEGGRISMNAQTRALRVEPFPDVAELIEVFNESSFFSDAIVPSITRGETNEGARVASFVFNVMYHELGLEDFGVAQPGVDGSTLQPGVSRQ